MQVEDFVKFVQTLVPTVPVQGNRMQAEPAQVVAVFPRPKANGLIMEGAFQEWELQVDSRALTDVAAESTLDTIHQSILTSYQSSFSMTSSSPAIWIVSIQVVTTPTYMGIDVERRACYRASYKVTAPA